MSSALFGRYRDIPAYFLVDPCRPGSVVSTSFAAHHNIPRTVCRSSGSAVVSLSCSGPFIIPSVGGYYQSTFAMPVGSTARGFDVILGADWCGQTGASVFNGRVVRSPLPVSLVGSQHTWLPQQSGEFI